MTEIGESTAEVLENLLKERVLKNKSYSVRAFARDCGISPASLSLILRKKSRLSKARARSVALKLKLSEPTREYFEVLAEIETAKSPAKKKIASLKRLRFMSSFRGSEDDRNLLVSQWFHLPIFELTTVTGFRSDPAWIANALGIDIRDAKEAVARLLRLGLLKIENGMLTKNQDSAVVPDGPSSDAIRSAHRSFLLRALDAAKKPAEDRLLSSTVIHCRTEDMPKVQNYLKEMRQTLMLELESQPQPDSVYALGIQFFRLGPQLGTQKD